jgi:hypothetical protein
MRRAFIIQSSLNETVGCWHYRSYPYEFTKILSSQKKSGLDRKAGMAFEMNNMSI